MPSDLAVGNGDLSPEFKEQVRSFARKLPELDFYEVLGVPVDADLDGIRAAFSERSLAYHPDRFFGRDLGPYGGLLHEIIKRVLAAYEVLRDPELREAYDRCRRRDPPKAAPTAPPLRRRTPRKRSDAVLAGLQRQLQLTRSKARRHFNEAMQVMNAGDLKRAHALLRLALIFDPRERTYQDTFGEVALNLSRTHAASLPRSDVEENP